MCNIQNTLHPHCDRRFGEGFLGENPKTRGGAEMVGQGLTHEQHVDLVGHEAQLTGN